MVSHVLVESARPDMARPRREGGRDPPLPSAHCLTDGERGVAAVSPRLGTQTTRNGPRKGGPSGCADTGRDPAPDPRRRCVGRSQPAGREPWPAAASRQGGPHGCADAHGQRARDLARVPSEVDLPHFAAFPLLQDPAGRDLLAEYYRDHIRIAANIQADIVLETPTWRANPDWAALLGYDSEALDRVNRDAVLFLRDLASGPETANVIVSGNIGPRDDGYNPAEQLTPDVAEAYHRPQIEAFAAAGADGVTMLTATHPGEAIGVVRAAVATGIPVVIAFTVETDGRLPNGQVLHEAIEEVDASTERAATHFGINCAHPDHFAGALEVASPAIGRIELLRANASRASHAELDEADELDDGDPLGSVPSTQNWHAHIHTCAFSEAAAGPTPGTSKQSLAPAHHERPDRTVRGRPPSRAAAAPHRLNEVLSRRLLR